MGHSIYVNVTEEGEELKLLKKLELTPGKIFNVGESTWVRVEVPEGFLTITLLILKNGGVTAQIKSPARFGHFYKSDRS